MSANDAEVRAWPHPEPPTEAALRRLFAAEGLRPYAWSNGPGDRLELPPGDRLELLPGGQDFLKSPARPCWTTCGPRPEQGEWGMTAQPGIVHTAAVGPRGVMCLEAQR